MRRTARATVKRPIDSIALVTSIAFSLSNFRGPLIASFVAAGIKVYALAPDHDEKTRAAMIALGAEPVDFHLERAGTRSFVDLNDARRLYGLLRRLRPDAVFSYFIKPVIYGSIAARLAGIGRRYALVAGLGYVFTANGDERLLGRRIMAALVSRLYRVALRSCDRVFFQNQDDIDQFINRGVIDRDRVVRLNGTGVDLTRFAVTPPVLQPITFLLMARLLREKGIYEYVAAARIVRHANPKARFLLLGDVDDNPGSIDRTTVEAWAAEGVIDWHGHVDDVRPWIAQSSVYVLPSYREGMPRSTQEAMAMGRPVVTTDAPGCRDTVREGVNGFKVPVRSIKLLAAAMQRFLDDSSLVETMGAASRAMAEELFDVHRINAIILATMEIDRTAVLSDRVAGDIGVDVADGFVQGAASNR
ncbi:glycosyltransferase family 4 protein [Sphingomonas oligophenolica]|uniref:Glycosyltransferase family 1 protein n=1 Tax=Sphingomonas oligophenolica TaxID=301154 RepID=A0A502C4M3_9SPHN|nr:glycosyltransferase family 4 protein [Sphingomonas oligophenolica]TPG08127.1 glycosyltransferase family 1 protein [Sphingomonas oligophenolica]